MRARKSNSGCYPNNEESKGKSTENGMETGIISGFIGSSVPKTRATILGIPMIRIIVHLVLYGVPLFSKTITSEE